MPGIVYRPIPKQVLTPSVTAIFIAKVIDISSFRGATLILRMHNHNLGATTTLNVTAWADAPTSEDGAEFVGSAAIGSTASLTDGSAAGSISVAAIGSANLPSFLRVRVVWTSAVSGTAVVSCDLVAKS